MIDFQWGLAQSSFCGRPLEGLVWLNLQFSVSWLVDFSGVRVAQSLVFCVMVGRLLVGVRVAQSLAFCVRVGFQLGSCGSIFSFLCHGRQTFSGVREAQSLVFCVMVVGGSCRLLVGCGSIFSFCVMVSRLLAGLVWQWLVDFQWGSCGSIFVCHVGRLLVGFVWLNLQFSVSWLVDFQFNLLFSVS